MRWNVEVESDLHPIEASKGKRLHHQHSPTHATLHEVRYDGLPRQQGIDRFPSHTQLPRLAEDLSKALGD